MCKFFVVGEAHGKSLLWIQRHVDFSDFDGVFLELPVDYQSDIDLCIASGEVSTRLECYFQGALSEGNDVRRDIFFLLDKARLLGIPIRCIDSRKTKQDEHQTRSKHGYYYLSGESRDEDMFRVIIRNCKLSEKWLVLCGANHANRGNGCHTNLPTLSEQLVRHFGEESVDIILIAESIKTTE